MNIRITMLAGLAALAVPLAANAADPPSAPRGTHSVDVEARVQASAEESAYRARPPQKRRGKLELPKKKKRGKLVVPKKKKRGKLVIPKK